MYGVFLSVYYINAYVNKYIHCVSKTSPMFSAVTRQSIVGFSYLAEILLRKQATKRCYIFPPHLINASALPCQTENTAKCIFSRKCSCWFAN